MKSSGKTAQPPIIRVAHFYLVTSLISFCMTVTGCGDCPTRDSPRLNERKFIPDALPTPKLHQPSPAGDDTVAWRGVDSGYYHD